MKAAIEKLKQTIESNQSYVQACERRLAQSAEAVSFEQKEIDEVKRYIESLTAGLKVLEAAHGA